MGVGLVLSGGGTRGLSHIGVLKILDKLGVKIDAIAGCSIGGIIGAFYSAGKTPKEIEKFFLKHNIYDYMGFSSISRTGINEMNKFRKLVEGFIKKTKFKQLNIPLYINATNISKSKETVFSTDDIFSAIRATISIPGLFSPLKIKKDYYLDGGILNQNPFSILPKEINRYIIIDASAYQKIRDEKKIDIINILETSVRIMQEEISSLKLKEIDPKNYILIKPNVSSHHLIETKKNFPEIIRKGELAGKRAIPEIRKRLNKKSFRK